MGKVHTVYEITKQLDELLSRADEIKRDDLINQVNSLIEKRGKSMALLSPPYTNEESKVGQEIVRLNLRIEKQMNELFTDLKKEMKQVRQQKKTNMKYRNPYKDVEVMDGRYLDKRE